jgi:oligoendopeptidase F
MPISIRRASIYIVVVVVVVPFAAAVAVVPVDSINMSSSSAKAPPPSTAAADEMLLPRWDLSSRFGFTSPFGAEIDSHLDETQRLAAQFKDAYEGKLSSNDSSLLDAIVAMEQIAERRALVSSYLNLSYDVCLQDDALLKRKGAIAQRQSALAGDYLSWFELDVAELPEDALAAQYVREPGLVKYRAYLDEVRRQRPHNLAKPVERALTVRSPYVGTRPLVSFFDKELSLMQFDLVGGDGSPSSMVNMEVLLSRLGSSKDAAVRAQCLKALNDGLEGPVARVAALSLSSVAGSWLIENNERAYPNLRSRRNLDNNCPDAVVESLLQGVRNAAVPLCQRYYGLKKRILQQTQGLQTFRWSDRNAPIDIVDQDPTGQSSSNKEKITWQEAVETVERGYRKFSPRMADLFMTMVNEKRIDVPTTNGKKGGAYCAGVIPGVGPFQLLNFDGTKQDVATLAHESGMYRGMCVLFTNRRVLSFVFSRPWLSRYPSLRTGLSAVSSTIDVGRNRINLWRNDCLSRLAGPGGIGPRKIDAFDEQDRRRDQLGRAAMLF